MPPAATAAQSVEALKPSAANMALGREPRSKKRGAIYRQTVRGLPGRPIVGIEHEPHYCQYGWTAG